MHMLALLRAGSGFGALLWATIINLAAFAVALLLAWLPRLLCPLARTVATWRKPRR